MRREGSFRKSVKNSLDADIKAAFSAARPGTWCAYERLLTIVQSRTRLLKPSGRLGDCRNQLNAAMFTMATQHGDWLRPIETWTTESTFFLPPVPYPGRSCPAGARQQ